LTTEQILEMQERYLMKSVEAWNDKVFVRGHGAVVVDLEGQEYIDAFSGVSVLNVGHTHPKVVDAVCDQMKKLTHLSTLYRTVPMPLLAKKLSEISPMDPGRAKVFFCNSGTEANEHALTLARIATGKFELLGLQNGFYGRGGLTMSLTGMGAWRTGLGPFMPGTIHLPGYHCYRCPLGHKDPEKCGIACARYLEVLLKSQTSRRVAAVIVEAIQGIGGIVPAPARYFEVLKPILDENKILLIVDEVQTGFGRTGKWFGIEHYGVKPDVVTMAKALGGGLPIGAVMAREAIADAFPGPDFSTLGGNPVSCRAGLAAIEATEEENLLENSAAVGAYMLEELQGLSHRHPMLDDVQGKGLMIGAEIVTDKASRNPAPDQTLQRILDEALKDNVLIGRGGFYYNRIRFQPSLTITREQAGKVLEAFDRALTVAEKQAG
ncbi:MAG: aspartate aminotransferase family protein, partial [Spirochaetales bacterium]|nr:aspartate aminotransferase family protein [Spirochaetales bacterium]